MAKQSKLKLQNKNEIKPTATPLDSRENCQTSFLSIVINPRRWSNSEERIVTTPCQAQTGSLVKAALVPESIFIIQTQIRPDQPEVTVRIRQVANSLCCLALCQQIKRSKVTFQSPEKS